MSTTFYMLSTFIFNLCAHFMNSPSTVQKLHSLYNVTEFFTNHSFSSVNYALFYKSLGNCMHFSSLSYMVTRMK